MKSTEFIIEDEVGQTIDSDMQDPHRRQARLKAEIEAGMMPGVHNITSSSSPVYTCGDVQALGWMDKEYTHDSEGEVDGWTRHYSGPKPRHYSGPKPIKILTHGAKGPQVLQPNEVLD